MNKLHFFFYFARKYIEDANYQNPWKLDHYCIPLFVFITSILLSSFPVVFITKFNKRELCLLYRELVLVGAGVALLIFLIHDKRFDFAFVFTQHYFFALTSFNCNLYVSTTCFCIVFYFLLFYGPFCSQFLMCKITQFHLLNLALIDCIVPVARRIVGIFIEELLL